MATPEPATRRLFVALRPPTSTVASLQDLVSPLAEEFDPAVRWSPAEGYHVTLRYIGDALVAPIIDALDRVLPSAPTTVDLGPSLIELGSAIAAPASGADELANLINDAVDGLGPPQPDRPFLGHLTLGRWRRGQTGDGLIGRPVSGRFVADSVELLASERQASSDESGDAETGESRYRVIQVWPAVGS